MAVAETAQTETETPNSEKETTSTDQAAQTSEAQDFSRTTDDKAEGDKPETGKSVLTEDAEGGDEKSEDGADKGDENPLFGAPEGDYDIAAALPEGMALDGDALAAIAPVAKELNLSNEGLGKVAAVYAEQVLPAVAKQIIDGIGADIAAQRATQDAATRQMITGGKAEDGAPIPADPAFDGLDVRSVQRIAAKALDRLGGEGFREALDETGFGSNPMMVKFAYLAGKLLSEDTSFERSGGQVQAPMTQEEKWYGKRS